MSKKFDVVIGNPPYQDEATGDATHNMPIYHLFMEAAYEVGKKAVLITPARFLFNAGYTPKVWNAKMLSDPHLTVPHYVPNSDQLFPGTDIKGGIAVTYRDEEKNEEPIGTFTKSPELNAILHKVLLGKSGSIASVITSSRSYRYTEAMHADYPEAVDTMSAGEQYKVNTRTFEQLSFLYHENQPADSHRYVRMLGLIKNKRVSRWIRSDYVTGPESFTTHKVAMPASNGSGVLGEVLSSPLVLAPNEAATQTFITIGSFAEQSEADACLKYVKSKFARTMLGVLKITQHNPAKVWKYVPLQDFTSAADVDWSKSIPEIDQQLYSKYKLDADEIAFIDLHIKPMG
ncbi:Eco57I restriction-modification methylase domain-containing protein [Homoserinimonas sp. A447]